MSFRVNLYSISKRDNSTKRPSGDPAEYDCILKDGCSILTPTIKLDIGLLSDPSQYNYAYIPAFGRYYYIEDWYFSDRLWIASMRVDVLATYKTQIGNSNLYVLRAAAAHDGDVIDTLYPAKAGCSYASDTKANPWQASCFIVGVVSSDASFGSLEYYAMSSSELRTLCLALTDPNEIITEENDFDLTELSVGLQLSLVDPIQYIKSCIMLPVAKEDITNLGTGQTITTYRFSAGTGNKIYPTSRIYKNYSFNISKHPDTAARGNYVNSAPFTNITLTIPPWGCIGIDTSVTANASTLEVDVEVDPVTGKGVLVTKANGIILNRLESQVGVPISLSSVTRDYIAAASAATSAASSTFSGISSGVSTGAAVGAAGGPVGAAVGAVVGGIGGGLMGAAGSVAQIGNAAAALMPRSQTIGTTGSFVANRGEFRLDHQFFRPVTDDPVHNGRPLCQMRTLNTLSGYMLIQDGDVSIAGTSSEDGLIKAYLQSGFYYE